MNKELKQDHIPYYLARRICDKGFDKPCYGYWSDWGDQEPFFISCELGNELESCRIRRKNFLCKGPLYQQVVDWLEEKCNFHLSRTWYDDNITPPRWTYHIGKHYLGSDYDEAIIEVLSLI